MDQPPSSPRPPRDPWASFRRLMLWMVLLAAVGCVVALAWLRYTVGALPVHMVIATVLGVSVSVLLGTALMGLVFVSNASGQDDRAARHEEE